MDPSRLIRRCVQSHPWYLVRGCHDCSSCHRHSCSLSPWVSRAAFALRLDGVCVWVCPSASKHGYWQGALATQLIPRYNNISNRTQVNWEPPARRLHHYTLPSYESKLFYSRFHCDFLWSDRHMLTVDECCAVAFVSVREAQENLKKKCCWCMHCSMIDASPPLAWASVYFITTLFTPWLCTSWGLGVQSAKRAILIAYWNSQLWWMDTR